MSFKKIFIRLNFSSLLDIPSLYCIRRQSGGVQRGGASLSDLACLFDACYQLKSTSQSRTARLTLRAAEHSERHVGMGDHRHKDDLLLAALRGIVVSALIRFAF